MNKKKAIIYFSISFVLIISFFVLIIFRTDKKESPVITDSYQFWESQSSSPDSLEKPAQTSKPKKTAKPKSSRTRKAGKRRTARSGSGRKTTVKTPEEDVYVDINHAGEDELVKLKGIGNATAEKIIEYRNTYGFFLETEEIMNVSGIGEKTYNDICEHIYVTISDEEYEWTMSLREQYQTDETDETADEKISDKPDEPDANEDEPPEEIPVIDINEAKAEDFMLLPDIDEETAENIIELRELIGGFTNVYELLYAEGMTENKLAGILDYVQVVETDEQPVQ